ncbi:MAG: DUF1214 domain-containing protein [Pseudomonadota bacterium]
MKYLIGLVAALAIIAGSALTARSLTIAALTDQTSIFDDFEQTDSLWLFSDKIGSPAASGLERAKVAIGGPLGLSAKEAVYFIALTDSDGDRLASECTYQVAGAPIDTRWWSLTLYDSMTQHYVSNEDNRSSWNSASIPRSTEGNWQLTVSPNRQQGSWLPSQEARGQPFELVLRVYNPSDATRAALPNITLPDVVRLSC